MKIVKAGFEILTPIDGIEILKHIEQCGRTCYKSEDKITEDSCKKFVAGLIKRGHEAMLEHYSISVKVICDRGVSHEIVRHRLASYAQESTRYCDYSKDKFEANLKFIQPCFWTQVNETNFAKADIWREVMMFLEDKYLRLIDLGATPEEARSVLPHSIKTEIIITMNLREWRHFFKLRAIGTTGKPHPQMQEIALPMLEEFKRLIPIVFDDITKQDM